jgi:hypothetical protein
MTILELLLDYLPERYVDAIVNNMNDRSSLFNEASSFSAELMTLFDWHESREGYEFWDEVLECVLTNHKLPTIPITIEYCPSTTIVTKKFIYVMNVEDTKLNLAFDFNRNTLINMNEVKKEKIFAFLN